MGAGAALEQAHAVAQFLYEEAALLDAGRFEEWLALLAPDVVYRAPVRTTKGRGEGSELSAEMFHFDETLETLRIRVQRLRTGTAWAEDPPSRTRHVVTNVRVRPGAADELVAESALLVYRNRGDDAGFDLLSAARTDTLRLVGGALCLARRLIAFDQATLGTRNLGIFF